MVKKSKAQIKRLMERAEARGEVYHPPAEKDEEENEAGDTATGADGAAPAIEPGTELGEKKSKIEGKTKLLAAKKLKVELAAIENDETLKAKERRSAKRKAEAIALESTSCQPDELLQWYEENGGQQESREEVNKSDGKTRNNPYILFVGQLDFSTSKKSLFEHIKTEIAEEHKVTEETVKIRLLTDPKTKKSRGMAFVEVTDPEFLYSLLKLHLTMLDGRRINVERSAGGGRNSENKKSKIKQYRTEQGDFMEGGVKNMLDEYKKSGEIQEGELDDGVVGLCKRHSATVVQASLERYVESNGRDMDNPSAYLSFLLGKLASEGIHDFDFTNADSERARKRAKQTHSKDRAEK
jgi:RNA recognition motif-containing protein